MPTVAAADTTLVVPDASVLLKWVLQGDGEPDRDAALGLRAAWLDERCELIVPTLWLYEVGNVLGLKRPADADAFLHALADLGLQEAAPHGYLPAIVTLMRQRKVTFYDAAYHALAIHVGGTMVTADAAYVRRARAAGSVVLLADWRR